jgi:hypothetical protein
MACDAYFATAVCEFPGCDHPAPVQGASRGDGFMALCLEHDATLFYAPEEFHRMWAERERDS